MLCCGFFFNNLYKVKSEVVLHLGYYAKMLKNQMCQTGWARTWYNNIWPPKPGLLIGFSSRVTLCGTRAFMSMKSLEVQAEGAGIASNVPHHHARRKRGMRQTAHGLWKLLSGSELCPLKFHWTEQDIWPGKGVGSIILSRACKGVEAEFAASRTNDCLSKVCRHPLPHAFQDMKLVPCLWL